MKRFVWMLILAALLLPGCGKQETEAPAPLTTAPPATQGSPSMDPADMITPLQAQAAALEHAGLQEQDVTGLHAAITIDNGIPQYAVDFRDGHIQYHYRIHAETGQVLSATQNQ